jgi:hypothetical protein
VSEPDDGLYVGYRRLRPGKASYTGVIRDARRLVVWHCAHDHATPDIGRRCAEAELERRRQGGREVFDLFHCDPCETWWTRAQAEARTGRRLGPHFVKGCPRCDVPLEAVRVQVLERRPVC